YAIICPSSLLPTELEKWYNSHPMIEFASLVETTITIKFIDGSYTLLMDIFSLMNGYDTENERKFYDSIDDFSSYNSVVCYRTNRFNTKSIGISLWQSSL
ncbi:hypothetical protein MBGDF03_01103, partial [Thermoplasmatales archaeon SCGC AB-540-F20]